MQKKKERNWKKGKCKKDERIKMSDEQICQILNINKEELKELLKD